MSGREAFLAKALAERGPCVQADGTTKYGSWFAAKVGNGVYRKADFCAMGLLWTADQTGQLDALGGVNKAWAWVPSWWQHFKSAGHSSGHPARGRIAFYDFNRSGDPEHVGAVLQDNSDGTFEAIEYNTLNGQCAIRTRRTADVIGFGDPAWPTTPTPPPVVTDDDCWVA